MKRYIIAALCGLAHSILLAQENSDLSVEVVRAYDPSLPTADKISRTPRIPLDSGGDVIRVAYLVKTIKPLTEGYLLNPISPAKVQHEISEDTKKLQGYVKLGIGYSLSTLLDAEIGGSASSSFAWDAYIKHYGTYGDITNSKNEEVPTFDIYNDIGIGMRKAFSSDFVVFNAGFSPKFAKYYGYDANNYTLQDYKHRNSDSANAQYLKTYANLLFSGNKTSWNYSANVSFHDFRAKRNRNEDAVEAEIMAEHSIDSALAVGAAVDGDIYVRSAALSQDNHFHFAITPFGKYKSGWWEANLRLNITIDKHHKTETMFLPSASFTSSLFDDIFCPYVEINSEYVSNSFANAAAENPYINPFDTLDLHETIKYDFIFGIKGKYKSLFDYKIWTDYAIVRNAHFFSSQEDANGSYFNFIYDNGGRFSANLNANFSISNSFNVGINYVFQKYYLDLLTHPLHKPEHAANITARYNYRNQFIVYGGAEVRGCYYFLTNNGDYKQNNAGVDLNCGIEYKFLKHSGVFLHLNNILSQKYQVYSNYDVYGFGAMIGYSVVF